MVFTIGIIAVVMHAVALLAVLARAAFQKSFRTIYATRATLKVLLLGQILMLLQIFSVWLLLCQLPVAVAIIMWWRSHLTWTKDGITVITPRQKTVLQTDEVTGLQAEVIEDETEKTAHQILLIVRQRAEPLNITAFDVWNLKSAMIDGLISQRLIVASGVELLLKRERLRISLAVIFFLLANFAIASGMVG